MTREQIRLRLEANSEMYVHNNKHACTDAIMKLYARIPDIGDVFKPLFRYRSLNEHELASLKDETIYMRWPSSYTDTSDCAPVLNYEEIGKYIIKKNHPLLDAEKTLNALVDIKTIKENPIVQEKLKNMQNMWMISCFTERHDNSRMWIEYANNCKGICLIYSFYDVLNKIKDTVGMSIMPVRYVENRDKCTDISLNHKDLLESGDETEAKYRLTCTTKEKLTYSFEEEWRLIYEREKENVDGEKEGDCISFVNPKQIICGKLVDKELAQYQELISIAEKKGIRVLS